MDRYEHLREDIQTVLNSCKEVLLALDEFERMPIPSKQMQLDLHLSSVEIQLHNMAKSMRERMLV
jgi:hypothetical protein